MAEDYKIIRTKPESGQVANIEPPTDLIRWFSEANTYVFLCERSPWISALRRMKNDDWKIDFKIRNGVSCFGLGYKLDFSTLSGVFLSMVLADCL